MRSPPPKVINKKSKRGGRGAISPPFFIMLFSNFNSKFQLFVSNLNKNMEIAVQANEKPLVDINREQMQQGINAEGQTIGAYRSTAYAKFKKSMGSRAPYRVPDLLLTGAFQKDMILVTEDTDYYITSTDDKTGELVDKYSDKIFGISKNNQSKAQEINTKKLAEMLKLATGL